MFVDKDGKESPDEIMLCACGFEGATGIKMKEGEVKRLFVTV